MVDTLHPPPSVVASWPRPNYIDPDTRGPALEYICIIFSAVAVVVLAARLYSRLFITRAPGLDDLLAVLALFASIALSVLVIIGNKLYYSGRHVWDIPPSTFVPHRINVWASMWCYVVAATLIKISVLLFYRRLSVKFSRIFLVATWLGIVYNVLYLAGFGLTLLLICDPVRAYWKQFDFSWAASTSYKCGAENVALPASAGLSVLGDLYSTLLPLLLIFNLDLPLRQKAALYSLFALGFLAISAGIVRTLLLYNMLNTDYDFTWVLWETWIWAVVELYVALSAASAPALKPFFRWFFVDSIGGSIIGRMASRQWWASRRSGTGTGTGTATRDANDRAAWPSYPSNDAGPVDLEKDPDPTIYYYGDSGRGEGPASPQKSSFLYDMEHHETRHFELRTSRDGKTKIPMQVYKGEQSISGSSNADMSMPMSMPSILVLGENEIEKQFSFQHHHETGQDHDDNWPLSASASPDPRNFASRDQLRPVGVGQQPGRKTSPVGSAQQQRTVLTPQWHTGRTQRFRPLGPDLRSSSSEDNDNSMHGGSRLESPSVSDLDVDSVFYLEKPPLNTIRSSSSSSSSDDVSTLHLPRMG
ncbi:hypothetical protein ABEF93_000394 [Exophiala dermatitidis]